MPTGDLSFQIRDGLWMIHHREILTHDVFTFTVGGQQWLNQQWGGELILGGLFRAVGWRGLMFVWALVASVAAGGTLARARSKGADPLIGGCIVLVGLEVAFLLPGTGALRPQLLAVPLFLLTLWLLDNRHAQPRRLLWLLPIGIAWANLHGSFVLLTLMAAVAFTADLAARRGRDATWTGGVVLASLVTPLVSPLGIGTYRYLGTILTSPVIREVIDEWQPLWRRSPAGPVALTVVIVAIVLVLREGSRRPSLEEGLQLALFTGLAIWSGRNLLWWALATPPILGGLLAGWHPKRTGIRRTTALVGVTLAALILVGSVRVATTSPAQALLSETPTQQMTEAVGEATRDGARVFDGWWGSWFELELPEVPMFIDARAELFPNEVWADYFRITFARPGWRQTLARWNIDVVVANKRYHPRLINLLRNDPGWTELEQDFQGVVFVRAATE
jgi:branched-subunit amino acid transport protein